MQFPTLQSICHNFFTHFILGIYSIKIKRCKERRGAAFLRHPVATIMRIVVMTSQFLFRSRPRYIGMNKIIFVLIVLVGNVIDSKRNGKSVDLFLERRRKSSPF